MTIWLQFCFNKKQVLKSTKAEFTRQAKKKKKNAGRKAYYCRRENDSERAYRHHLTGAEVFFVPLSKLNSKKHLDTLVFEDQCLFLLPLMNARYYLFLNIHLS